MCNQVGKSMFTAPSQVKRKLLQINANTSAACDLFEPMPQLPPEFIYHVTDLHNGLLCLNSIKIGYENAWDHVISLANIFQEYYVYSDIAKNPLASIYSSPWNFTVFSEKVELINELQVVANSWPQNQSVGLLDVALPVTELFIRLRDNHVTYYGANANNMEGSYFGDILSKFSLWLRDTKDDLFVTSLEVLPGTKGREALCYTQDLADMIKQQVVKSIDGLPFVTWVTKTFAEDPAFPLMYKPLGSRVNSALIRLHDYTYGGHYYSMSSIGNVNRLANKTYHVKFVDGNSTTWKWVILNTGLNISNRDLAGLTQDANVPGFAWQALARASELYFNLTRPTPTNSSEGRHRSMLGLSNVTGSAAGSNVTVYPIFEGDTPVGEYWVKPKEYAVMKLTTMGLSPMELMEAWKDLVSKSTGVTNLILDLTDNGGGDVATSYIWAQSLYPGVEPNLYDRNIGPAARYLISSGLEFTALNATVSQLLDNQTYMEQRVAELNNNRTEFQALVDDTNAVLAFIYELYNQSSLLQDLNGCDAIFDCRDVWAQLDDKTIDVRTAMNDIAATGSAVTTQLLSDVLESILEAANYINPYIVDVDRIKAPDGSVNSYLDYVYHQRGGVNNTYTNTFQIADEVAYKREMYLREQDELFESSNGTAGLDLSDIGLDIPTIDWNAYQPPEKWTPPSSHPFKKILAVGNGLCGSACDQFSRTSWFYSLAHPEAPVFRYATYGGNGNRDDLSGTVFCGGNVIYTDYVSQSWAYYGLVSLVADWTDNKTLIQHGDEFGSLLPTPPYGQLYTPRYSQSEMYQRAMGPDALPMEYYIVPTDYYIQKWFYDTGLGGDDLHALYNNAAAFFKKMPAPAKPKKAGGGKGGAGMVKGRMLFK